MFIVDCTMSNILRLVLFSYCSEYFLVWKEGKSGCWLIEETCFMKTTYNEMLIWLGPSNRYVNVGLLTRSQWYRSVFTSSPSPCLHVVDGKCRALGCGQWWRKWLAVSTYKLNIKMKITKLFKDKNTKRLLQGKTNMIRLTLNKIQFCHEIVKTIFFSKPKVYGLKNFKENRIFRKRTVIPNRLATSLVTKWTHKLWFLCLMAHKASWNIWCLNDPCWRTVMVLFNP